MKHLAEELIAKAEASSKDVSDMKRLIDRTLMHIENFRNDHGFIAGTAESAIGIAAIAFGASIFDPVDYGTKVPELIGAVTGAGIGGKLGSMVGGIGIVMMGTGFAIPAAVVTAIGATAGALSGSIAGWFGDELASHTSSLLETLSLNVSGAVLVAFGCYMLFLGLKDLWRAGGEFITFVKGLGVKEISMEELS